jgi:hypothetical protein
MQKFRIFFMLLFQRLLECAKVSESHRIRGTALRPLTLPPKRKTAAFAAMFHSSCLLIFYTAISG